MRRVVPAILANDESSLTALVDSATATGAAWVQVDIMDGVFVTSQSVGPLAFLGKRLPFHWEVHLMVKEPLGYIDCFLTAGAERIVFHYEAVRSHLNVIRAIKERALGVGLALNPGTPVSAIIPFVTELDSVLFLSVQPGYYGAKFIPETLDKIRELSTRYPKLEIGIDGGIKESNICEAAGAGANDLCVGSAIFMASNPTEAYQKLSSLIA